jgi:hypothetical protein
MAPRTVLGAIFDEAVTDFGQVVQAVLRQDSLCRASLERAHRHELR